MRTLLDNLQKTPWPIDPKHGHRVASAVYAAKRFIFDVKASALCGEFIRNRFAVIEDADFTTVRPPFPTTYVELNVLALSDAQGNPPNNRDTADRRVGYLFCDGIVYCLFGGNDPKEFGWLYPLAYRIGPQTAPLSEVLCEPVSKGKGESCKGIFLVGGFAQYDMAKCQGVGALKVFLADVQKFSDRLDMIHIGSPGHDYRIGLPKIICQGGGEAVHSLAALHLINNLRHKLVMVDVPAARIMHRNKAVARRPYTTISLNLGAPQERIVALPGPPALNNTPRREHDVRGHYAHFGLKSECDHHWEPLGNEGVRFTCLSCNVRRTWRRSHRRGDPTMAAPSKTYHAHHNV